jgi:mannose-1-phosphate guanylyltransferase
VLLPSDHHVRREAIRLCALRQAAEQLHWRSDEPVLLGLEAERPDPPLGYIMPGRSDGRGARETLQVVEKPSLARARELIEQGGLWNGGAHEELVGRNGIGTAASRQGYRGVRTW